MSDSGVFNIVTTGKVLPGFIKEEVQAQLARLFNRSSNEVARLLTGVPLTLKRNVDASTANAYVSRLKQIGVDCSAERETLEIEDSVFSDVGPAASPTGLAGAGAPLASPIGARPPQAASVGAESTATETSHSHSMPLNSESDSGGREPTTTSIFGNRQRGARGASDIRSGSPARHAIRGQPEESIGEANQAEAETNLALWNPNTASNWSVVFTPVFGAYLHALNWRSLGEVQRASKSLRWVYAGIGLLIINVLFVLLTYNKNDSGRGIGPIFLVFLLAWYFGSARAQVKYVKEKYGTSFQRKPWGRPLLIAVGCIAGYLVAVILLVVIADAFHPFVDKDIALVKKGTLTECPGTTVERVVEGFIDKPAYASGVADGGEHFVNVTGGITYSGKPARALLQFRVGQKDNTSRIQGFAIDNVAQSDAMTTAVLLKMCASASGRASTAEHSSPVIASSAASTQAETEPQRGSDKPVATPAFASYRPVSGASSAHSSSDSPEAPPIAKPGQAPADSLQTTYTIDRIINLRAPTADERQLLSASPAKDLVKTNFEIATVDLNGDGVDEYVVVDESSSSGNGGCETMVLKRDGGSFAVKLDESTFFAQTGQFAVLKESKMGFRMLGETVNGKLVLGDKRDTPMYGRPMVVVIGP